MRKITTLILSSSVAFAALYGCKQDQHAALKSESSIQDTSLAQTASAVIEHAGQIEPVVLFYGAMPTGVAVSKEGRIFVTFPRWGDPVDFTVAEIVDGKPVAFPNNLSQQPEKQDRSDTLISAQSVVVDQVNRLWILDTGSIKFGPVSPGGPKLIAIDLNTNEIKKKIMFPDNVALPNSYFNDVCFDLDRGEEGTAFITDSSDNGTNAIIVVDLKSGKSWRKLERHGSVYPDQNFVPIVEGQPLMVSETGKNPEPLKMGADGIALDTRQDLLYFCPLASRQLYRVKLDALMQDQTDEQTAAAVQEMPARDFASDGLICDRNGVLYLTDYEHNAIRRYVPETQRYEIVASDSRMIWPDSMAIGHNGDLYFTANQLNRQPRFHQGQDKREKPFALFRIPDLLGNGATARAD